MRFCRHPLYRWTAILLLQCLLLGSLLPGTAQVVMPRGVTVLQDICAANIDTLSEFKALQSQEPSTGLLPHTPHCLFCLTPGDLSAPPQAACLSTLLPLVVRMARVVGVTLSLRFSAFWERPLVRAPPLLTSPCPKGHAIFG
jgi:hypothetical protein